MTPTKGPISKPPKVNKAIRDFGDTGGATSSAKTAAFGSRMQSSDIIQPYRSTSITTRNSIQISTHEDQNDSMSDKRLIADSSWDFPPIIVDFYQRKGITEFFDWQVKCLLLQGVLQGRNLVYSAPTSAGKSLVSDVLLYKTLLKRKKKGIIVLPYVSITVERVQSLKQLFRRMGYSIESFAGNLNPPGGFELVDVAVCTIEKANNMFNRIIKEGKLSDIGIVIVDEVHMLGDSSRGHLLESLLSKLIYHSQQAQKTSESCPLQIVGMSASIPNLSGISKWLNAERFVTDYRPVPLYQKVVSGLEVYQLDGVKLQDVETLQATTKLNLADLSITPMCDAPLIYMAIDTVISGFSALVFCPTKNRCQTLSLAIAKNIHKFGSIWAKKSPSNVRTKSIGKQLVEQLGANTSKINSLIESVKQTPDGIDPDLENMLRAGVAFHHAGLSIEVRALIENAFRNKTIRILCATTTLASGVNLPARRVFISSPYKYQKILLDVTTFRQMTGRAGRMGIDTQGEAILFCKPDDGEKERKRCMGSLVLSDLPPIKSHLFSNKKTSASSSSSKSGPLEMSDNFKRVILEVISNGTATKYSDILKYIKCTFFYANFTNLPNQQSNSSASTPNLTTAIDQVFNYLLGNKLIYLKDGTDFKDPELCIHSLGKAIVASGLSPDEGMFINTELDKARKSLFLCNDLHLVYQITPTDVADDLRTNSTNSTNSTTIDWNHYLNIFNKLDADCKCVADLLKITKDYFDKRISLMMEPKPGSEAYPELLIYKRFYVSLALLDLIQESSVSQVAVKYELEKSLVQSLQQRAATFAGMVSTFCGKLGLSSMQLLIEPFQPRLSFGIKRELLDLLRISFLTPQLARQLFSNGYDTLISLIYRKESDIENALIGNSGRTTSNDASKTALTTVFIPNLGKYLTIRQLAQMIRQEARTLVEGEINRKLNFEESDRQSEEDELISPSSPSLEANSQESGSQSGPLTASTKDHKAKQVDVPGVSIKQPSVACAFPVRSSLNAAGRQSSLQVSTSVPYQRTSTPNERQHRPRAMNQPAQVVAAMDPGTPQRNLNQPISNSNIPDDVFSSDYFSEDFSDDLDDLMSHNTRTTSIDNISTCSKDDSKDDIDFFQSFHQNNQQGQLPTAFEATQNIKEPVDFQLVEVTTEQLVKQLIKEIFAEHVLSKEGSVLDLAMHFTLEDIKESFGVQPVKKRKTTQQSQEGTTLRIEDRYPLQLRHLYFARLGNKRVYHINDKSMFECLQKLLLPELVKLDTDFYHQPSPGPGQSLSSAASLSKPRFRMYTYNVKEALYILQYGFRLPIDSLLHRFDWHDVSVAIWLLDPEAKPAFDIDQLSLKDLLDRSVPFKLPQDYLKKAQNNFKIEEALFKATKRQGQVQVGPSECLLKAALLFHLTGQFCQRLNDSNLYLAYKLIEVPSRLTLYRMETQGITVDAEQLSKEQRRLAAHLDDLESEIYRLAGCRFNLDSPDEVANVLYEKLNLHSNLFDVNTLSRIRSIVASKSRWQPNSPSTSKWTLIKLQEACKGSTNLPILIMEWRRVNHALIKTVGPIQKALQFEKNDTKSGLIYCRCDEWTVTGRISMHDPNLINVDKNFSLNSISVAPITFELRRNIRAREGYQLVSADYAQLELRILALFSNDLCLREALKDPGNDVFKLIAANWKNISLEEVTSELRQQAKQICYGIIYGIGIERLAENLAVTEEEAAQFRKSFLQRYWQIGTFEEQVHTQCSIDGYVETISHRRRPIANIFSRDRSLKAKGERQALNTKIQGSAADITKLAMVAVDEAIDGSSFDSVLVLQMHDELMYEVRDVEDAPQRFSHLLQTTMEKVSSHLNVSLTVKVKIGPNWGQMNDFTNSQL